MVVMGTVWVSEWQLRCCGDPFEVGAWVRSIRAVANELEQRPDGLYPAAGYLVEVAP